MRRIAVVSLVLLLLLMAVPAGVVLAGPLDIIVEEGEIVDHDVDVFGDELILRAGGVIDGDVTVYGGSASIAGVIDGDLTIMGGNVTLSGVVGGDLVTFGGNLNITSEGRVGGDCAVVGGHVEDESTSASCASFGSGAVWPNLADRIQPPGTFVPDLNPPPQVEVPSSGSPLLSLHARLLGVVGQTILAGLVAFLIAALMPYQLRRVTNVVRDKPAASGGVGLLTIVAGPSLLVLLLLFSALLTLICIGILGYPIVIGLGLALFLAALFGWVAMGNVLGDAILGLARIKDRHVAATATIGTMVLTFILGLLAIPRFFPGEGLAAFILLCLGLGATALTQFGTKPYPRDRTRAEKFEAAGVEAD